MNQNYAIPIAIPPQQQQQQLQQQLQQQQQQQGLGIPPNLLPQQPQASQQQTPPAKPEDEDGANGGTSIDTFQEYKPTALPVEVVRACNDWYNAKSNSQKSNANSNENNDSVAKEEIINLCKKSENTSVVDLTEEDIKIEDGNENDTNLRKVSDNAESIVASDLPSSLPLEVPSHTSSACESALLSSVSAPMVPEATVECLLPLLQSIPEQQNNTKVPPPLSPLQLEGVLLSIQRHRRIHHPSSDTSNTSVTPNVNLQKPFRAGFFLGDGAGIGKGRQISAILRDGFCRGRKRHVWISVSRELIKDAQRDLRDVGLHCANDFVHDGTRFLGEGGSGLGNKGLGRTEKGVLFLTYNLLVSANRIEQIIAWCAGTEHLRSKSSKSTSKSKSAATALEESFDGCVVFDEAHKAKNLADNTKTAQLVLMLQRRLPMARVVYCSATGVSEIDQLAYAERLGLWKISGKGGVPSYDIPGTNNHATGFSDFSAFKRSLEKRGLGSLELLALELKTRGSFMARTLSWEGADFQTAEVPLDKEQRMIYDRCVSWWNNCKTDLGNALHFLSNIPGSGSSNARQVWGTFWAAHQRCFKELAICAKVPFLAKDALRHIHEEGCCVVFGLQGTGEAGMQSLLQDIADNSDDGNSKKNQRLQVDMKRFPALMSTVSACLTNFVRQHFPVAPFPPDVPTMPKLAPTTDAEVRYCAMIQAEIDRIRSLPPPLPIPALMEQRKTLLDAIRYLDLPPNPLDDLIDRLGGVECVAEMTGRSGRIVRDNKTDEFVYSKRVVSSDARNSSTPAIQRGEDSDRINLIERRLFMDGSKSAAIISDAASTGVSLHAARGSGASHKRRVHYTIELPWSADKAVQQLGRSHRSGQESAPIYKLVVTNLGGERRFAAAVSKRLASLGALTKGDRRAATGSDMSEFDLDSKYGKRALKRFYNALEENEASGGESSMGVMGVLSSESGKAKAIIGDFVKDSSVVGDPIVRSLPSDDEKLRNACVLSIALAELDRVGLDKAARSKADVRIFLNRLSGLMVTRQSLVFSLFMSTLGGVMNIAKTSGEFEGTAEDLAATSIEIDHETDLGIDPSSGAKTKLTNLVLDRGIPFKTVRALAMDESEKTSFSVAGDDGCEDGTKFEDFDDGRIAESGFYLSKNKIGGRHLILFGKRKFDPSKFKTDDERFAVDPLGLMQITRPNTGVNLTDKSTRDLRHAYRLILGCDKIRELSPEEQEALKESAKENEDPQHYIKMSKKIASLWKLAFKESNSFKHENGLAPRRQRVSLVNGPVLHILPALEKAVQFRSEKEKALKIMRAKVGSRRIVGVRFPSDEDALEKLLAELDTIQKARKNAGKTFIDEDLVPICPKTMSWATTKRKTMKSFFRVTSTNTASAAKSTTKLQPITNAGKKRSPVTKLSSGNSGKKPKSSTKMMTAYFSKKK